jgi:hypothetical protein
VLRIGSTWARSCLISSSSWSSCSHLCASRSNDSSAPPTHPRVGRAASRRSGSALRAESIRKSRRSATVTAYQSSMAFSRSMS